MPVKASAISAAWASGSSTARRNVAQAMAGERPSATARSSFNDIANIKNFPTLAPHGRAPRGHSCLTFLLPPLSGSGQLRENTEERQSQDGTATPRNVKA